MVTRKIAGMFIGMVLIFSGCVCSSDEYDITQKPNMKKVSIQLCGAKEWWGNVVIVSDSVKSILKPSYDTTTFELGELKTGTKFTLKTGVGKYEFFKAPDSIRVIMGKDTTITYFPEGLEKMYVVK